MSRFGDWSTLNCVKQIGQLRVSEHRHYGSGRITQRRPSTQQPPLQLLHERAAGCLIVYNDERNMDLRAERPQPLVRRESESSIPHVITRDERTQQPATGAYVSGR